MTWESVGDSSPNVRWFSDSRKMLMPQTVLRSDLWSTCSGGRALEWGHAVLRGNPDLSFPVFLSRFKEVFDKGACPDAAAQRLVSLKQGKRSMADFSVDFRILAEEAGWEEKALRGVFLNSINDDLKYELATRDLPQSLEAVISLCIRIDDRLRAWRTPGKYNAQHATHHVGSGERRDSPEDVTGDAATPGDQEEQPMQLGRARPQNDGGGGRRVSASIVARGVTSLLPVRFAQKPGPVSNGGVTDGPH